MLRNKRPPFVPLPLAFSNWGLIAEVSTNFLLRPSAKMILREATNCCHFYSATQRLLAAEKSTDTSSAVYTVRAHILTGTLTQTCTTRYTVRETHLKHTALQQETFVIQLSSWGGKKKGTTVWIFSTLTNEHFFRSQVSHRELAESTPVDSVTLKINKVIRRCALPPPTSPFSNTTRGVTELKRSFAIGAASFAAGVTTHACTPTHAHAENFVVLP